MKTAMLLAIAALTAAATTPATADIVWDEATDGDLSNSGLAPTFIGLGLGQNTMIMDVIDSDDPSGDLDYFSITIGAGQVLDSIILVSSDLPLGGFDATAFFALQLGSQVTVDPANPDPTPLAGFVIGSPPLVGTDILPELAGGFGPTLGPGDYSFWVQQTGEDLTRITLDFNVVPTPASLGVVMAFGGLAAARRRR